RITAHGDKQDGESPAGVPDILGDELELLVGRHLRFVRLRYFSSNLRLLNGDNKGRTVVIAKPELTSRWYDLIVVGLDPVDCDIVLGRKLDRVSAGPGLLQAEMKPADSKIVRRIGDIGFLIRATKRDRLSVQAEMLMLSRKRSLDVSNGDAGQQNLEGRT